VSLIGLNKIKAFTAQVSVPSRFNLAVDLPRQRKAVLNTFTGALVVIPGKTWRQYLAASCQVSAVPERMGFLQEQGCLVSQDVNELDLVRVHYFSKQFSDSKLGVTIVPTLACNLSCSYCFEGTAQTAKPVRAWTRERENQVVRHIAAAASGKNAMEICWFGGEPLLAIKTITHISSLLIAACKQAGMTYSATLVTNGTMLTRDNVHALEKCALSYMQVTVDVPAAEKLDRRGRSTVDTVLDNLAFAAKRIPTFLRINLVRDEPAEFDRLYEALIRRKLHQHLAKIHFAYVFAPEAGPRGCRFSAMPYPVYTEVTARERCRARAAGLPIDGACVPEPIGCSATRRHYMVIGPDGLLYKCPEDVGLADRSYGSVDSAALVNLANLVPWLTYDWLQYEQCAECPALPGCGRGCPHIQRFQPEQFNGMQYCESFLQQLRDRIRDRALASPELQSGNVQTASTVTKAGGRA
jgi:uncharacterized protein